MKRVLSFLLALSVTITVFAEVRGHYWLDVEEQHIPVENITDYFSEWFNLGEGVTFTVFNDETDNIGMRHIAYQQYIGGVKAEHQMILVHARDGKVVSVNTSIIEAANQPKSIRPRLSKKQVKEQIPSAIGDVELLIITCTIDGVETSRLAYKTIDFVNHEDVYIDAETGEIIKRISRIYSADIQGKGNTLYQGWQDMTINQTDGYYILSDNSRKILTVDATSANPSLLSFDFKNCTNKSDSIQIINTDFNNYLATCQHFSSSTSTWDNSPILRSVTITSTPDDSWWSSITNAKPDFYIKIYDEKGNWLYTSPAKDDMAFDKKEYPSLIEPFIIPSGIPLLAEGYTIYIYDYDPLDDDDYGGSVKISDISKNGYLYWKGTKTEGYILIGRPEIDAHWGMQKTYDFYKEVFGRKSYDNAGTILLQLISPPFSQCSYGNAAATYYTKPLFNTVIPEYIVYGLGNGVYDRPHIAIETVAHEFTHMVTRNNGHGGLEYQGESGALNESFSDIFGFSVENYVLDDMDYLFGEDIMVNYSNIRSMKNPKLSMDGQEYYKQPDTYKGINWVNTSDISDNNDHGGVHTNSGVQNKWFYLLSEGGAGTNDRGYAYNVRGITIQKAQQIAYRNLMYYLLPQDNHHDSREGSLQAAKDLYGEGSQEYVSTANAWHAVGVGVQFEEPDPNPEVTELVSGDYVVVAQRKANTNYFYMTSTPTNGRYTAVDTKTSDLNAVVAKDLGSEYVWTVVKNGETIQLKNGSQFSTWNGGNKAILGTTGKDLTVTANEDGSFTLTFAESETVTRYLSLNADTKYDYFAYYGNTNQIEQLHFLPYTASATTNVEQLTVSDIHAYSIDNTIIIEAVNATPIMVFDAMGQCIFNEVVSSARVPATHGGMYLVKTPTEVVKVIVR